MAVSRASLLRGAFRADTGKQPIRPEPIRPPWAIPDARGFAAACDACGRCGPACPERIITIDRIGRPVVDFSENGCTFCGACAEACPTGALARSAPDVAPWTLTARIGADCLSFNGTDCRVCADHCDERAIRFRPLGRGRWLPDIEAVDCTGCGACVGVCPVKAVTVAPPDGTSV
ncbi:ferredoxin-type protein NapF [Azospirillum sp. sgz302134]